MNYLPVTFYRILLLVVIMSLSGCLPHPTTERAAVVIFNDTTSAIQYQLIISGKLTPLTEIREQEFDYIYEYEQSGGNDVLPAELSQVVLIVTGCRIVLKQNELERYFVVDPDGRNTLNLHVTGKLVKQSGC